MTDSKVCRRCGVEKGAAEFRVDPRYRDGLGSWCRECHRQRNTSWAIENRERLSAKSAERRAADPDAARAANRRFKRRHKEALAAKYSEWQARNKDKVRAIRARRKAAQLRATPLWADAAAIAEVYREATRLQAETGQRMHVDHIVPLQHPLVCGLHVAENLQVLPGAVNESKRNNWEPCFFTPRIRKAYAQPDMFLESAKAPAPKQETLL